MATRPRVLLDPKRCDRCGRCLSACSRNAIRIGRTFIAVDPVTCDGCMACVRVCDGGALRASGAPAQAARSDRNRPPKPVPVHAPSATPRARSRTTSASDAQREGWTLLEALAMLSVTLAAFVGKEILVIAEPVRSLPTGALVLVRSLTLGAYYSVQFVALRWLVHRRGRTLWSLLAGSHARGLVEVARSAGLALAILVGSRLFGVLYGLAMRAAGVLPDSSALSQSFGSDPSGLILAAVLVAGIGPFIEEMVFRGLLLQGLESRIGPAWAIVCQAIIFAALHRSVWLFVPMAVLGAALGWLVRSRRGLWPAVAVHAAYNAITVVVALMVPAG